MHLYKTYQISWFLSKCNFQLKIIGNVLMAGLRHRPVVQNSPTTAPSNALHPTNPDESKKKATPSRPFSFLHALAVLTFIRLGWSLALPILSDCDETFNFWEPLHYAHHGYGLQTWEYSPKYAIRSWSYILLHLLPIHSLPLSKV